MRPLLIGQAPGPNTDPDMPLFPSPATSAGGRLARFMGLSELEYLETFDRINLLQNFPGKNKVNEDRFPIAKARIAADAILPLLSGRTAIMVGRNVATAFGYPMSELEFHSWVLSRGARIAVIPHTSGRCFWYNKEENLVRARQFWGAFFKELRQRPFMGEPQQKPVAFLPSLVKHVA